MLTRWLVAFLRRCLQGDLWEITTLGLPICVLTTDDETTDDRCCWCLLLSYAFAPRMTRLLRNQRQRNVSSSSEGE